MRPGQLKPNDFELAILKRLAGKQPSITGCIDRLHVLSRKFTGVGSYTNFKRRESDTDASKHHIHLDGLINMPGVPHGMGAVLWVKGEEPDCLEVFTYGDDHWDGAYDGFSVEQTD